MSYPFVAATKELWICGHYKEIINIKNIKTSKKSKSGNYTQDKYRARI